VQPVLGSVAAQADTTSVTGIGAHTASRETGGSPSTSGGSQMREFSSYGSERGRERPYSNPL
jgi:hypothetical protein